MAGRMDGTKTLSLTIDAAMVPWVEFVSALGGESMNAYINEAIARDCDRADSETAKAYVAFLAARKGRRVTFGDGAAPEAEDGGE